MKDTPKLAAWAALAVLLIASALAGCGTSAKTEAQTPTAADAAIQPLPQALDIADLDNSVAAVSLQPGDAYADSTGTAWMKVMIYDYDRYDAAQIAQMKVGDTISLEGQLVTVSTLERDHTGEVKINGGLEQDGYTLMTDNNLCYQVLASDAHAWKEMGTAVFRLADDFLFTDTANLEQGETTYQSADFLTPGTDLVYNFTPNNTTITIRDGQIAAMNRVYTP